LRRSGLPTSARQRSSGIEKTGTAIYNAIVWQDRRTAKFCDGLKAAGHSDLIQSRAGLVIDAYFSGSKLRWILDNVPGARERASRGELAFGTVDAWLIWKLTGGAHHLTDVTNASRTMLFNLRTGTWDDELLKVLDVPREVLPTVRASSEVYAETAAGLFDSPIKNRGHCRRSTGSTLRPELFLTRSGQEHLRNWLLHADEHRRGADGFEA
jgi:glycerol kinase